MDLNEMKQQNKTYSLELTSKIHGKYIAILPIRDRLASKNKMFSIDYFGVQGEYTSENLCCYKDNPLPGNNTVFLNWNNLKIKKNNSLLEEPKSIEVKSWLQRKEDVIIKANVYKTLELKDRRFSLEYQSNEAYQIISSTMKIFTVRDNKLVEIKTQFKENNFDLISEKIKEFEIILFDKQAQPLSKIQILDLYNFFLIQYKTKIFKVFEQNFNIKKCVTELLSETNNSLLKSYKSLLNNLITFANNAKYFDEVFSQFIDNLSCFKALQKGLKVFWNLVFYHLNEKESNLMEKIGGFFHKTTKNINQLNKKQLKVLKAVDIKECPVNPFEYLKKAETSNEDTQQDISNQCLTLQNINLMNHHAVSLKKSNYQEYYINLIYPVEMVALGVKIENIKRLFTFNMSISEFNPITDKFETIRQDLYQKNFVSQILNSSQTQKDYDFSISLKNKIRKLLKIQINFNFLPNFEFMKLKGLNFEFRVFGNKIEKFLLENEKFFGMYVLKTNNKFTNIS